MSEKLILGTTYPVFIGITLICMCTFAILMGRALARAWRPARHTLRYGLLLGVADRFLIYALFDGDIRSVSGFVIDLYCILLSALIAYRLTLVAQMVRQYPWLYERFLLFAWRPRRIPLS